MSDIEKLTPDEDKVLRFVVAQSFELQGAVTYTAVDSHLKDDSIPSLQRLEGRGLIYRTTRGEYLPTVDSLLLHPPEPVQPSVESIVGGVIELGREVLDSGKQDRRAELDAVVDYLIRRKGPSFVSPQLRFRLGLALHGLEPYVTAQGDTDNGIPTAIYFGPKLFKVSSLADIVRQKDLERREASRASLSFAFPDFPTPGVRERNSGEERLVRHLRELEDSYEPSEASIREILRRDAQEVELCRQVGAWKAVLVLCGSILEAVLLDVLNRRSDLAKPYFGKGRRRGSFPEDASLQDLLEMATTTGLAVGLAPLLGDAHKALVSSVINHRDLIHPHRELRGGEHQVDEATAEHLYAGLCVVIRDVRNAIRDGWLMKYLVAGG